MDEDDHDKLMREFERRFMRPGVHGVHTADLEDIELFEEMMKALILPHLMLGDVPGGINGVKAMRLDSNNSTNPHRQSRNEYNDLSWLDKYL